MKLEVLVVPVSDVDRANGSTRGWGSAWISTMSPVRPSGWHSSRLRVPKRRSSSVRASPPPRRVRSRICTSSFSASRRRADLVGRGIDVSEVFHDAGGIFHHAGNEGRVAGPDPERSDYGSFASFNDPDGNGWLLQEVKKRAPGR